MPRIPTITAGGSFPIARVDVPRVPSGAEPALAAAEAFGKVAEFAVRLGQMQRKLQDREDELNLKTASIQLKTGFEATTFQITRDVPMQNVEAVTQRGLEFTRQTDDLLKRLTGTLSARAKRAFNAVAPALREQAALDFRINSLKELSIVQVQQLVQQGKDTARLAAGAPPEAIETLSREYRAEVDRFVSGGHLSFKIGEDLKITFDKDVQGEHANVLLRTPEGRIRLRRGIVAGERSTEARPEGLIESGNIDLSTRPVVRNPDGSISTLRSMSFNDDGVEILIPTISPEGRQMPPDEAIQHFRSTGQHLGKFSSSEAATAFSKKLSAEMPEGKRRSFGGEFDKLDHSEITTILSRARALDEADATRSAQAATDVRTDVLRTLSSQATSGTLPQSTLNEILANRHPLVTPDEGRALAALNAAPPSPESNVTVARLQQAYRSEVVQAGGPAKEIFDKYGNAALQLQSSLTRPNAALSAFLNELGSDQLQLRSLEAQGLREAYTRAIKTIDGEFDIAKPSFTGLPGVDRRIRARVAQEKKRVDDAIFQAWRDGALPQEILDIGRREIDKILKQRGTPQETQEQTEDEKLFR